MTEREQQAFDAMRDVLQVIDAAPRTHPEKQGSTYWQYNLIPHTIERMRSALVLAEKATEEP